MNKKETMDSYKTLATKVAIPVCRRFRHTLNRLGLTEYAALQNCIDVFVRFGDDKHNLTPETELLMGTFEHCETWKDYFNLADPTTTPEITEATYYLRDKKKRETRVVHLERGFFKPWTKIDNTQQILEKFFCLALPQLYKRLRLLAIKRGQNSILELLLAVVSENEKEADKQELRRTFEDAERSEWGVNPTSQPYKAKHFHSASNDNESIFDTD